MTTAQLGKRLGVSQPRIPAIEKAEANRSITLDTLEKAAAALDCELCYVFVPKTTFQEEVLHQAKKVARKKFRLVQHTMALEAQSVDRIENEREIDRLARTLADKSGSELWDEQ